MKIALLGYGKMGKSIEQIALSRHHSITLKTTSSNRNLNFSNTDVAIDFSIPSTAESHIKAAIDANIPVISGTTGWLNNYPQIVEYCKLKEGAFLYASNFSLGVNIFFELNKRLAQLMTGTDSYSVSMEEIHHTEKLDAPSGTAISLAETIIEHSNYTNWSLNNAQKQSIPIMAKRIANVPGTHSVCYKSEIDTIDITHTAHNRKGFALGAVIAAEWIVGKKGIFSMKDVLNIG